MPATPIYILLLCFQATQTCQIQGPPRMTFAGVMQPIWFSSVDACEGYARRASGVVAPPARGPILLPNGMWYECRSTERKR